MTITASRNDFPRITRAALGKPQPREGAQSCACRAVEPQAVVPLMSIVFERKFVMPSWMEPPRLRRPSEASGGVTSRVPPVECAVPVESGVADNVTRSASLSESTPSVTGSSRQPQVAAAVSSRVEGYVPPHSEFERGPTTGPEPRVLPWRAPDGRPRVSWAITPTYGVGTRGRRSPY